MASKWLRTYEALTWVMGTSSTALSGHIACHISRATSPWRLATPLAARDVRSANWVTPNGSAASDGFVRPRDRDSALGPTPFFAAIYAFVNLHHYFMDNVIWRRENPLTRYLQAAPAETAAPSAGA